MVHSQSSSGDLTEQSQDYDIHGRVSKLQFYLIGYIDEIFRHYLQLIEEL
jgi:hypothetical protein